MVPAGVSRAIEAEDGHSFDCFFAGESGSPKPAIIIFTTIFGITADMRRLAERWVGRGYLVAIPDYFSRVVPGPLEHSEEGRRSAMERWARLDRGRAVADIEPLRRRLADHAGCNGAILTIGICAGGEVAFLAAARMNIAAAATYHATYIDRHLDEASAVMGQLSLHYGERDDLVPMTQVEVIRSRLADRESANVYVYPNAGHGFTLAGRPSYEMKAATSSDQRVQELFARFKAGM